MAMSPASTPTISMSGPATPAAPLLLWAVRPRDGPNLQGGVVSPAAGLRDPEHAVAWHARAAGNGAGRGRPLVVAIADDVRAVRQRVCALCRVDGVADQAALQRRPAAEVHRHHRAAS